MYVDELVLRDFRAIAASRIQLVNPLSAEADQLEHPNVNLMVGGNGSGKSSVLKAVTAAITGSRRQGFRELVEGWPRIGGGGAADVVVRLSSGTRDRLDLHEAELGIGPGDRLEVTPGRQGWFDGCVVAAYGPRRRPSQRSTPGSWGRPHLLFDDAPLVSLERWLPESDHRDRVAELLNGLLPEDIRCRPEPDGEGRILSQRDVSLPVGSLSDGVQSFLAWVGDLLARVAALADDDLQEVTGVVLVDEIDQHLQPEWQRSLIGRLATTFPALQFICTTQSPMVVSALRRRNLHLVESELDSLTGATTVRQFAYEDVYGLTADQVLRSSYFQLESSRPDAVVTELRNLANRAQLADAGPEESLRFMQRVAELNRQARGDQ